MPPNTGAEAKTPETPDQDQARSVAPPGESSTTIPRSQAGSDKVPSAAAQVPQTSPQTRGAAGTLPLRTLCHRPSAHQPNTSTIDVGRKDHGLLSPRIKAQDAQSSPSSFASPLTLRQANFPTLRISYPARSILFCTSATDFIADRRSAQCRCLIS